MSSLVAYLLLGSSAPVPTPSVRELIVEAAPGFTLYANGYAAGFADARKPPPALLVFR